MPNKRPPPLLVNFSFFLQLLASKLQSSHVCIQIYVIANNTKACQEFVPGTTLNNNVFYLLRRQYICHNWESSTIRLHSQFLTSLVVMIFLLMESIIFSFYNLNKIFKLKSIQLNLKKKKVYKYTVMLLHKLL